MLIANRGEIALRIMRTCRAMGLGTVAVYSDADAGAAHVRAADVAVRLGPAPARESYLRVDAIVAAAQRTGADAVHPGYGFLAENPALAEACVAAGLTFIGPTAEVIRTLGSKRGAKLLALQAGVPVVPGYTGEAQATEALVAAAADVGLPLLVKASAGGGGKGMRIVRAQAELTDAIDRARSEALAAFGDGTLLLERYLEQPRHIEIQILGDTHGTVVHLGERECSVQRRHQKLIEETPAANLPAATRDAMGAAAVALARAVGYVGAGTVEFIVDAGGGFYFLEVNTRLQVEHPVTEAVTGLDLVREQLRIAAGEAMSLTTTPVPRGHAIEARLCAEDADAGHLPRPGRALDVRLGDGDGGVRVDGSLGPGDEAVGEYDSMLAKVVVHAPTRAEAIARLRTALDAAWLPGLTTNAAFLARVLAHRAFGAGALHTHFLADHAAALVAPTLADATLELALVAVTLVDVDRRRGPLPLAVPTAYRNVAAGPHAAGATMTLRHGDRAIVVGRRQIGAALHVTVGAALLIVHESLVERRGPSWRVGFVVDGVRHQAWVAVDGGVADVPATHYVGLGDHRVTLVEPPRAVPSAVAAAAAGGLRAPMPGKIVALPVAPGARVAAGDVVVVLEAMKMEHALRAPHAGVLRHLPAAVGSQVAADAVLAEIDADPS